MLSQQMPKMNKKDQDQVSLSFFLFLCGKLAQLSRSCFNVLQVVVTYVENLLKLESSSIGQVGGNMIFMMVMERLRDLDVSNRIRVVTPLSNLVTE